MQEALVFACARRHIYMTKKKIKHKIKLNILFGNKVVDLVISGKNKESFV